MAEPTLPESGTRSYPLPPVDADAILVELSEDFARENATLRRQLALTTARLRAAAVESAERAETIDALTAEVARLGAELEAESKRARKRERRNAEKGDGVDDGDGLEPSATDPGPTATYTCDVDGCGAVSAVDEHDEELHALANVPVPQSEPAAT